MEDEIYFSERFTKAQAWIDLLLLANHKPNIIYIRGNEVRTERGQLCYSMVSLAGRWKWDRRIVNRFLAEQHKAGKVYIRKTRLTTIITIQNYDKYQKMDNRMYNRMYTNNNDKEVKKIIPLNEKKSFQGTRPGMTATQQHFKQQKEANNA
jgi:hypothetical protein